MKAPQLSGRLTCDGDLTGGPVSNSSTSYPNAGHGHMDDAIQLGYQAVQAQEAETRHQIDQQRVLVYELEAEYREKQRPERP